MKRPLIFLAFTSCAVLLASTAGYGQVSETDELTRKPVLAFDNQGKAPKQNRLIIKSSVPVTEAMREQVAAYGTVHGVIHNRNLIVVTPRGSRARATIEGFDFVESVETDRIRWLSAVGTWDRDILDVVDVEADAAPWLNDDAREVAETGAGVHVAVIDTGMMREWRSFIDEGRVATGLARAFMGGGATAEDFVPVDEFTTSNPTDMWQRDTNSHGTSVASHVVGFKFAGTVIDGVAPEATIIPLKVFPNGEAFTWSSRIIAAIDYVTQLKIDGVIGPVVINMSLGGGAPGTADRAAIDDAIAAGVIVVASAGNEGEAGMGWPGAYPEVISAAAAGFVNQFTAASFWRSVDVPNDPDGTGDSEEQNAFIATFSSRAIPSLGTGFGIDPQELDVVAPGQFTVAPCRLAGVGGGNETFCFWSGTSFSSPLTAGVAALIVGKNPALDQAAVEGIMKSTTLPMSGDDSRIIPVPIIAGEGSWDTDCNGEPCDPVGAGFLQADAALEATPAP
ncbi:MAG: S8 family serine peptidase [Gammaproteobacteria bacterium]|nr:S8 family serine peptidase [Gammaproteobacteria bacterium]